MTRACPTPTSYRYVRHPRGGRRRVARARSGSLPNASAPSATSTTASTSPTVGWILSGIHDPDGHEVRFYTTDYHSDLVGDEVLVVEDPIGSEMQREQAYRASMRR
jgi:hypothetical protein